MRTLMRKPMRRDPRLVLSSMLGHAYKPRGSGRMQWNNMSSSSMYLILEIFVVSITTKIIHMKIN